MTTHRCIAGLLLLVVLGGSAAGLAACGSPAADGLVLYNGQHEQTTSALVSAFEHTTGQRVSIRSNDEDVLAAQIGEEGSASPADVIYTENSPALEYLARHHLLARLPRSVLGEVPSRYDSPGGYFVGVSARVSMLVYNTRDLRRSELPRSVLDLASPRWRNKLAIAPEETDFQPIVTAVAHAYGASRALAWLRGIEANGATHEYQDSETVTSMVNSGQAEIGIVNQYYWYRLRAEVGQAAMHSALAFFRPGDPGYVVDVSGAAVLASSRHPKAAVAFVAFLVSRRGQRIIARSDSFEYPLVAGVAAPAGERPLDRLQPYPIGLPALGTGEEAIGLMREAGLVP